MTQSNSHHVPAQPARATTGNFAASVSSMRTVALSLLVDRALSA